MKKEERESRSGRLDAFRASWGRVGRVIPCGRKAEIRQDSPPSFLSLRLFFSSALLF